MKLTTKRKSRLTLKELRLQHDQGVCGPRCKICPLDTLQTLDTHLADHNENGNFNADCQFCRADHDPQPMSKVPTAVLTRLVEDLNRIKEWLNK